jgi:alkyldihydroxyacetonephosphate synthase
LSPSGSGVVVSDASEAVKTIVATLAEHFEAAEEAVANVISNLEANGFPNPDEMHITQYLPQNTNRPLFLMRVAAQMKMASSKSRMVNTTLNAAPIFQRVDASSNPDSESLGAWGYQDSYFVLNVGPDGSKHVVMKGKRYGISGKKLPRLAKFVETELNIKINPNDVTFPAVENLQHIPATALNNDDLSVIAAVFGSGMGQVSIKPLDRARHGTGHTQEDMYGLRSGSLRSRLPDVIVRPKSEDEVKSLISLATDKNYCLIPFGGGTNVTHATHCPEKSDDPRPMISVDMKSMNRVVWVNKEDGLAHVEAGITGRQLIEHMEKLGFTIGHEPDSYEFSTLGGWIATKASGMKQNRYGNIEDIVKEVNVAGANGLVSNVHSAKETSFGRVSTGVDFKSIMLGSEGCLGIITSAVIKIWPIAEATSYESVLLPDFDAGLRFAKAISKMRTMKPASVRLLDNDQFRLGQALKPESSRLEQLKNAVSKQFGYYYGRLSEKTVVCATITFEGSVLEVQMQKKALRDIAASHCGILAGPAVGKAGYDLTFAIAYLRDFALNYRILGESFESFVPWSKLKHVIEATKQRILYEHRSRSLPGVPFVCSRITQLYDEGACVYFYFCMDISGIPNPSTTFATIEECARQAILHAGGSLSHHHGVGKLRAPFVHQIYSDGYMNSLIAVKKALDPDNVFGVGNGVLANHTPCDKDSGMK